METPEFTDWDKECDLLIEFLNWKVAYNINPRDIYFSPTKVLLKRRPFDEILRTFRESGFIFITANEMTKPPLQTYYIEDIDFEFWKENIKKEFITAFKLKEIYSQERSN